MKRMTEMRLFNCIVLYCAVSYCIMLYFAVL